MINLLRASGDPEVGVGEYSRVRPGARLLRAEGEMAPAGTVGLLGSPGRRCGWRASAETNLLLWT